MNDRSSLHKPRPIVMVTHDNRILDVADQLIYMEDGELESYDLETEASPEKAIALG